MKQNSVFSHPRIGINKGIKKVWRLVMIIIVCACANVELAASPSYTGLAGSMPQTTFRSTSSTLTRSAQTRGYSSGYHATKPNSTYNYNAGTYSPASRLHSTSAYTTRSYGGSSISSYGNNYCGKQLQKTGYKYNGISTPVFGATTSSVSPRATISYYRPLHSNQYTQRNTYFAGGSYEKDGMGNYYDEEKEEWLPIPDNPGSYMNQLSADGTKMWNGYAWIDAPTQPAPLGDISIILTLFLAIIVAFRRKRQLFFIVPSNRRSR